MATAKRVGMTSLKRVIDAPAKKAPQAKVPKKKVPKAKKKVMKKKVSNPNSPANYGKAMSAAYKNTKTFGVGVGY